MEDSEVVGSIVAGDPHGLDDAFDRHADPLYKYCRTLLRDPSDAADAVQDAFVVAAARLDRLREPDRLRAWLYALARNESLRILRSKKRAPAGAPEVPRDPADVRHDGEQPDLRALFEDACDGLNPGEREVIELQLRQGLDPAEVAAVLGLSRGHAHTLLTRAGEQLWTCLAVLLVSRAGRDSCGELDALLAGWDGRLTVPLRKRIHRHIEHCAVCGARRSFELRPAKLREMAPGAALAAGAELSLRLAPGLPEGLRAHTIAMASGQGEGAVVHRAAVLSRAGAFDHNGFPKARGRRGALRSSPRVQATEAAAVVAAVAIAVGAFALTGNTQLFTSGAAPKPPTAPGAAVTAPTVGQTHPQPTARGTSATPTPTASSSAKPSRKSTSSTSASTSTTASPSPTKRSPTRGAGSPTSSPTPTPTPGTLSDSPQGGTAAAPEALVLAPDGAGKQIELSASGSGNWNVGWSVSVANDSGGAVSVSPTESGTLTPAGATTTLTVTANQFIPCGSASDPTITVEPGGVVYSVCTSLL
jgi:RNA polymerase sigma factor (sigma-70 family)